MNKVIMQRLARMRQRIGYSASWFGMLGVPLLVVDLFQEKLALLGISVSFWLLTIVTILGMALSGYMFEKMGFIQLEYEWAYDMNEKMKKDITKKEINIYGDNE